MKRVNSISILIEIHTYPVFFKELSGIGCPAIISLINLTNGLLEFQYEKRGTSTAVMPTVVENIYIDSVVQEQK